ncbi:MAG TPA: hypothetical protein VFG79_00115, partial [Solirubrobacter sp.]|nr:hypothetical protein [Solirubrobacter sp.]
MIRHLAHGQPWPSLRWVAAGLGVALAAALGGWLVAKALAPEPAKTPSTSKVLAAGPARLKVSTGWTEVRQPPVLPGLADAPAWTPYAGLATTVSVALVPPQDAALLPSSLVEQAKGGLPRAEVARVVGLEARAYRGLRTGKSVLDVYAIPTTRGVLTLVCTAKGDGGPEAPTWCLNGLDQITVEGAKPLKPQRDTAYRLRAPAVFEKLDAARVAQRKALRGAKKSGGQKRAALALARAYRAAAAALAPMAPAKSAPARELAALRSAAAAYARLATAADRRSRPG